jgi:hypothetical protein
MPVLITLSAFTWFLIKTKIGRLLGLVIAKYVLANPFFWIFLMILFVKLR